MNHDIPELQVKLQNNNTGENIRYQFVFRYTLFSHRVPSLFLFIQSPDIFFHRLHYSGSFTHFSGEISAGGLNAYAVRAMNDDDDGEIETILFCGGSTKRAIPKSKRNENKMKINAMKSTDVTRNHVTLA